MGSNERSIDEEDPRKLWPRSGDHHNWPLSKNPTELSQEKNKKTKKSCTIKAIKIPHRSLVKQDPTSKEDGTALLKD